MYAGTHTHIQDKLDLYSHVSVFRRLFVLLKYWGFSITGILVMPMITASGPISEEDGVLLPLETWWRGEAESSSLLITEDGPKRAERGGTGTAESTCFTLSLTEKGVQHLSATLVCGHKWKNESVNPLLTEIEEIIWKWAGEAFMCNNTVRSKTRTHNSIVRVCVGYVD